MTLTVQTKIVIRWRTKDDEAIEAIRKRFKLPRYTTINGWTPGTLKSADQELFDECARRGFFTYMANEWSFNGATYSW